jgi:hypothetical protein
MINKRQNEKPMIPSVTTILQPYTDFSSIRPEVLQQAAERGTRFHRYASARLQGLMLPPVTPDLQGFVASWEQWAADMVDQVYGVELALQDDAFGYCGHLDAIIRIHGDKKLTIVDWKTPVQVQKTWELQVAGYRRLAEVAGFDIGREMSVRPDRNGGRAKVTEYTRYPVALQSFLGALSVWRFMNG